MKDDMHTANGYLRGCHGGWLTVSVSSRRRRAAASRPLAHMLVQLHNFTYLADSGRRRRHLASNFVTNSARSQKKANDAALPLTTATLHTQDDCTCTCNEGCGKMLGYWLWRTATAWMKYSNKRETTVPGGWARAVSDSPQLATQNVEKPTSDPLAKRVQSHYTQTSTIRGFKTIQ